MASNETEPTTSARSSARDRNGKIAAVAAAVVLLALAWRLGIFAQLRDPAQLAKSLVELGVWGYVAFVLAYAILQPFGLPGTVFVLAAPLIWPWPIAFALSMIGSMAASVASFSFARFIARDWVSTKIPERFTKYNDALAERAFVTVVVLRLIFWMHPLLHAFFGVSKVKGWTHFWGSFVGYLLPLFLMCYFGQKLFDYLRNAPLSAWLTFGAATLLVALSIVMWRRMRGRVQSVGS